jgi:outer membrane lipoprotein LolB
MRAWWAPFTIAWLLLAGCANPPRVIQTPGQPVTQWNGRLALRIDADPVQSFSAGFELKGNAQAGELSLYSPLGATVAKMAWAPGDARLRWDGKERSFDSMDALTLQAIGTELQVASL